MFVHGGLFDGFHNPPNSDMDIRTFIPRMWHSGMRRYTHRASVYSMIQKII